MNKLKLNPKSMAGVVAVFAVIMLSLSICVASAQYETQQIIDVTIPDSGVFHAEETGTVGVSCDIAGTSGAIGTVTASVYSANPEPDATVPSNVALSHFVVITFDMAASDFQGANITIHYTDEDVHGLTAPYSLYKFLPLTNTFVELNATMDTEAKTMTAFLSSTTDPLFAIGGAPTVANTASPLTTGTAAPTTDTIPVWVWAFVVTIVIVAVVVVLVIAQNRHKEPSFKVLS